MQTDKNVEALSRLLRGEMSAVETYDQALKKLNDDAAIIRELTRCRSSHQDRVDMLRGEVSRFGGQPPNGSGPWGAFAKLVEGGAKMLGKKAAIAALEEGEDHGLKQYREDLAKLDASVRSTLEARLLSEQEQTHLAMSNLKRTIH